MSRTSIVLHVEKKEGPAAHAFESLSYVITHVDSESELDTVSDLRRHSVQVLYRFAGMPKVHS